MTYTPLTLARRHVLGDLYRRCDRSTNEVPVYLNDSSGEQLGYADEGLGRYADAFTFHLPEDVCKGMAGGQFIYSFEYHFSGSLSATATPSKRRIRLISIFLTMRKPYEKPIPRTEKAELKTAESET